MLVHAFKPSTGGRQENHCEFAASLLYREIVRPARATQWDTAGFFF